jgi:hypothetical protein
LDLSSWIILFALLPFSVLAFLSQGAVPGDLFYPVKRGLENVVLAASSVHPATKVAFRTDLTERRFKEAEQLLLSQGQTVALTEFVGHVQTVEEEIIKLSSLGDKQEASAKLIEKIEEYEVQLAVVQAQVEQQQEVPQPTSTPIPQTPAPGQTASPTPEQTQTPTPVQTPASTQKPTVEIPFVTQPTPTPASIDSSKKEEVVTKVEETKEKLKEIKERVKREREDAEVREKIKEEQKRLQENLKNSGDENDD